jgi:hypothetical protein
MAYRVVVGDKTLVKKVVVGTPLDTVVIGPYADIDNIVGVSTTGKQDGSTFVYNDSSGVWEAGEYSVDTVDGKFYPSDSPHTNILIRRSGTQGEPVTLQQGELAYSFLPDGSTDGFGNGGDRLYIATGANDVNGNSTKIDVIGGKYYTDLLNHSHGKLVANSALIVDSEKSIDQLIADSAYFQHLRVDQEGVIGTVITSEVQFNTDLTFKDKSLNKILELDSAAGIHFYYAGREQARVDSDLFTINNNFNVDGLTTLDSTTIDGDLSITGNLSIFGQLTNVSSSQLVIEDKQIVIADGTPFSQPQLADGAGFSVGDSAYSISSINYRNNGVDSACWTFSDGICAPSIKVPELKFEVIDCGTYA